jgi:hypothetical protein
MNTSSYDDMIAKAIQLVVNVGSIEINVLGKHRNFQDERISIRAFITSGVELLIEYTGGSLILEIWKGTIIVHEGDHSEIYEHLNKIFYGWHETFNVLTLA